MATAKKTKSGKYRVLTCETINGKKIRKSFTADTKREAEYQAAAYLAEQRRIEHDMTLYEAINRYTDTRSAVCSPSTIRSYRKIANNQLGSLSNIRISKIDSKAVQKHINEFAITHSPKTTRNMYALIKAALKQFSPNTVINATLPPLKKQRYKLPTAAEVSMLINECEDIELKKAMMLGAYCALRREEIPVLEASDLVGRKLTINKAIVQDEFSKWVIKGTKTSASDSVIMIPEFVADFLRENSPETGRIVNIGPGVIDTRFRKYKKKKGVDTTFHNLRHFAASFLHANNMSDIYIKSYGRWNDISTVRKIYINEITDEQERAANIIDSLFTSVHNSVHKN